jgi:N-acetylmuramoyl-L-alanine amidase
MLLMGTVWAQDDEPLYLNITFPTQSDTVNADRVRLSGHTRPDATLRINYEKIDLFPQGSFATRVDLAEGMNQIILTAQKNDELVQDILFIYRPPKKTSLPEQPTVIDKINMQPEQDVWLMNGDYLTVEFQGSPGGSASFSVEKFEKDIPMLEVPQSQTNGVAGIYRGIVKLMDVPQERELAIDFELTGVDKKKRRRRPSGNLLVLPDYIPRIGHTTASTFMHAASKGYSPFTRIPDSVQVHIIGRDNGRYKIDLLTRTGFIDAEDIRLDAPGTPLPRTTLAAPYFEQDSEWFRMVMPIGAKVPFETHVQANPLRLELMLYGARQASHWITYPNSAIDLVNLELKQKDDFVFSLSAEMNQDKSWGHKVEYQNGSLIFSIRRQPMIDLWHPLRNVVVALDPGHGGEETGAVSPLGVFEKDINWMLAEKLAALLKQRGADVILTRSQDETVSLPERIKRAENAGAHFFLSLHNNATTAAGNPVQAQGTSVYFTLPQNKELTWAIYPHMVKIGLSPYGRIHNSYFVTNATSFLVTLIEGGFLTNPHEELKLASEDFSERMAVAVYKGLEDFLKAQAE